MLKVLHVIPFYIATYKQTHYAYVHRTVYISVLYIKHRATFKLCSALPIGFIKMMLETQATV